MFVFFVYYIQVIPFYLYEYLTICRDQHNYKKLIGTTSVLNILNRNFQNNVICMNQNRLSCMLSEYLSQMYL